MRCNSSWEGGAINAQNPGLDVLLEDSNIENCSAAMWGGGVSIGSDVKFSINNSTLLGNKCVSGIGGAIALFYDGAELYLNGTSISSSRAQAGKYCACPRNNTIVPFRVMTMRP